MDYDDYYMQQIGSGLPVFKGSRYQKGMGLGSMFRSFFRCILPVFKTHALPAIKSGAKAVGSEAVRSVANIATDAINGQDIEESAKKHAIDSFNTLSTKAKQAIQSGSGYKKVEKK